MRDVPKRRDINPPKKVDSFPSGANAPPPDIKTRPSDTNTERPPSPRDMADLLAKRGRPPATETGERSLDDSGTTPRLPSQSELPSPGTQQPARADANAERPPSPSDIAARSAGRGRPLATETGERSLDKRHPLSQSELPPGDRQPTRADITSQKKDSLAQKIEGTDLAAHPRTVEYLDMLSQQSFPSLPESLQEVTKIVRSELSKAISHYKSGQGMDSHNLQDAIGKIGGAYKMYLRGSYVERLFVAKIGGAVSELKHVNQLVDSKQATSPIISGARGNGHILERGSAEKREAVTVNIAPVQEADALYLGRDGKVHIDEVKQTVRALRNTLQHAPDQLQNLATWRDQVPQEREVRIVVDRQARWMNLFDKIDEKHPESPSDLLVAHRIPIQIGDITFSPGNLESLNRQIQLVVRESKETRSVVLDQLSVQYSPQNIQLRGYRLNEVG